jgi:hypothetical protein
MDGDEDDDDDAAMELEAMVSIMGDDMHEVAVDDGEGRLLVFRVAPECDEGVEAAGAVALSLRLPPGYPHTAEAAVEAVSRVADHECFASACGSGGGGGWAPSAAQAADIAAAVRAVAGDRSGEPVVWDAVSAARDWLEANTLSIFSLAERVKAAATVSGGGVASQSATAAATAATAAATSETAATAAAASARGRAVPTVHDSDLDDPAFLLALRGAVRGDASRSLSLEAAIVTGKAVSSERRAALRAVWTGLAEAQRLSMFASSSSSSSWVEEGGAAGGVDGGGGCGGGGAGRGGGKGPAAECTPSAGGSSGASTQTNRMPPPAQRSCERGHVLAPMVTKPRDYRHLDGFGFFCDACGKDTMRYETGRTTVPPTRLGSRHLNHIKVKSSQVTIKTAA